MMLAGIVIDAILAFIVALCVIVEIDIWARLITRWQRERVA